MEHQNSTYSIYNTHYFLDDDLDIACPTCGIYYPGDTNGICFAQEQQEESAGMMYHYGKNTSYWALVKKIVQESNNNYNPDFAIFLIDILEDYIIQNRIIYSKISEVIYKYRGEIYCIPKNEGMHLIENLQINRWNQPAFAFEYDNRSGSYILEIINN